MTHDEIFKTKPGRELDALVAEHVFGSTQWCPDDPPSLPHFSTNTADAFQIVDWMLEYAHDFELEWTGEFGDKAWFCYMGMPAYANTRELAICRAALSEMLEG